MTWKELEQKIYDIIANGDELLTDQDKVDLIMKEIEKFENGKE